METFYEFLQEARLEKFYPAFQANGITRSEALVNLGMPEFYALGITSAEDKRRLVELINIIKSVQNSGLGDSPQPGRKNMSTNNIMSPQKGASKEFDNEDKKKKQKSRGISKYDSANEKTPIAVESNRISNFSVASYVEILQRMQETSESDETEESDIEQPPFLQASGNLSSPSTVRTSTRGPVERIKYNQSKGYNYGVHKVNSTPSKTKVSKSGGQRFTGDEKIKVCVRKRPLTKREMKLKEEDIVAVESTNSLIVNEPKLAVDLKAYTLQHEFIFDEVFAESCSNEDVYIRAARPLISCIFNGGTATCFAYGQTGAGKTHTMLGNEETPGLYLLAGQDIFSIINSGQYGQGLHVWVSFFEIYCGQLFDLLNKRNRLHAREDGNRQVCIAGLTETEASNVLSLVQVLEFGNSVRSKGATGVNPDSSRSHAVLQLDIRDSKDVKKGKISFIDLAGSERASDVTDTDRQTRLEGAEINQSLLALKECIRSIDQESRHTPFRQSKLTHILKDSFIGNSRTCMIANISPTHTACENTLNTLRYADRVKELKKDTVRSSSVSHAMNLLMNIPPNAPLLFHPSNVLSSTPARPQSSSYTEIDSGSDIDLDPNETPIRGHGITQHAKYKESKNSSRFLTNPVDADRYVRSSNLATAASHGSPNPPPDASPSESDHTDTDSCNATLPANSNNLVKSTINQAVAKSMDSDGDFQTSDFNKSDELNDLNRSNAPQKPSLARSEPSSPGPSGAAAATVETLLSHNEPFQLTKTPKLKPVIYKPVELKTKTEPLYLRQNNFISTPVSEIIQKFQTSGVVSPKISQHPPSFKNSYLKTLVRSDESFDDDELFGEGPPTVIHVNDGSRNETVNLEKQTLSKPLNNPTAHQEKQRGQNDLNDLSQNHEPENLSTSNSATPNNPQIWLQQQNTIHTNSKTNTEPSNSSLKRIDQKADIVNTSRNSVQQQSLALKAKYISSPLPDKGIKNIPAACGGLHPPSPPSGTVPRSPNVRRYSSVTDRPRRRRRASNSPTGEISDDSTDSIRASFSDQGQGAYKNASAMKSLMRKEHSDPMLVLDQQRKKSSHPDSQQLSRMLSKSNSIKTPVSKVGKDDSTLTNSPLNDTVEKTEAAHSNTSVAPDRKSLPQASQSNVAYTSPVQVQYPQMSASTPIKPEPTAKSHSEKSLADSVFSPIEPQAITCASSVSVSQLSTVSSSVKTLYKEQDLLANKPEVQQARLHLVSAHEDQLATVTSLCKHEMRLLLSAKKSAGKMSFDNYLRRVEDILSQKMATIHSLQAKIVNYRKNVESSQGHFLEGLADDDVQINS